MTWQQARRDAEFRIRALLEATQKSGVDPREICISLGLYQSQDVLDLLQPDNRLPLAYHQQVTRATMRLLRTRKFDVDLIPITLTDFYAWLGDRDDTHEAHKRYLKEKLSSDL